MINMIQLSSTFKLWVLALSVGIFQGQADPSNIPFGVPVVILPYKEAPWPVVERAAGI